MDDRIAESVARTDEGRATRRTVLGGATLAAAAAAAATAAGCGPAPEQAPGGASGARLEGTTVEYWNMWQPTHPEEVARLKVLDNFNAQNPHGVKVSTTAAAGSNPASMDKIIGAMAANTPPDLINTYNFNMADVFSRGSTVDVDAGLKGNADWARARPSIYPNIVGGLSWKGKLYAIPSHNSYFLMYYNPVALKRVGLATPPPRAWSWDAFVEDMKKASRPAEDLYGYDSPWEYEYWGMLLLNNGATIISRDATKYQINSPESVQTAEWELSLVRNGLQRKHDGDKGGYRELIPEGKVVFQLAVPNRVRRWRQQGGIEFGTCFYPLGPRNTSRANYSQGTAYGFAVFKSKDPKKEQAGLLAGLWASRVDSGMVFAEEGGVPPSYKHIVESTEFKAQWQKDADTWPFYEALPNFVPDPNFPLFRDSKVPINQELGAIWSGKTSVKDGLNEAQKLAQQFLDKSIG